MLSKQEQFDKLQTLAMRLQDQTSEAVKLLDEVMETLADSGEVDWQSPQPERS